MSITLSKFTTTPDINSHVNLQLWFNVVTSGVLPLNENYMYLFSEL